MAQTQSYDTLGRVSSVVNALGTFNYGYQNDSNRMTSMSIPNGEQVKATYLGAAGDFRLSQIQNLQSAASGGANISTFGYTYNPEEAIATWSQTLGSGAAINYTLGYDNTDELTSGTATGSTYGYTYDAGGNRLSETINGATRTAVYNAANQLQQLTPAKLGDKTYQWDAENWLVGINYTGTNQSTQLKYDGLGRCVEIQELTGGAITSTRLFVWCGAERCEEHNATNAVTKRFFNQGEQINGQSYYYLKDHLGSIRELTDSSGAVKAEYSYDFWGRPTLVQGTNLADFQYGGMFAHQSSGLNLTWYRAYDSASGRWLSRDPLAEQVGSNLYQYSFNSPIVLIDQLGLYPLFPLWPNTPYEAGPTDQNAQPIGLPAGNPWKWSPDKNNKRTGTWTRCQNGKNQNASWDPSPKGKQGRFGQPHWDFNDGEGNSSWISSDGSTLSYDDVHPSGPPYDPNAQGNTPNQGGLTPSEEDLPPGERAAPPGEAMPTPGEPGAPPPLEEIPPEEIPPIVE